MPSSPESSGTSPYKNKIKLHKKVISEDSQLFDEKTKEKIKKKCKALLSHHPDQVGEPLRFELKGYRKLRISEYRVVYRVDKQDRTVFILAVGMRREEEIYRTALKRLESERRVEDS